MKNSLTEEKPENEFEIGELYAKVHERILKIQDPSEFLTEDVIAYLEENKAFTRTFLYIFDDERKEVDDSNIIEEFNKFFVEKWFPQSKFHFYFKRK